MQVQASGRNYITMPVASQGDRFWLLYTLGVIGAAGRGCGAREAEIEQGCQMGLPSADGLGDSTDGWQAAKLPLALAKPVPQP